MRSNPGPSARKNRTTSIASQPKNEMDIQVGLSPEPAAGMNRLESHFHDWL